MGSLPQWVVRRETVQQPGESLGRRKINVERGALAGVAVGKDESLALLDDHVDRHQSEPRTLALLFGREERLEDMR